MKIFRGLKDFLLLIHHRHCWSEKKIRGYQLEKLKELTEFAREHCGYYRETLKDRSFSSLDEYSSLPEIDKQILMDNFIGLNSCGIEKDDAMNYAVDRENRRDFLGYYRDEYILGLSSGTSGNKGLYITPRELTERLPFVFPARSGIPLMLLPFRILFLLRVFSQGFDDIRSPFINLKYLSTMEDIDLIIGHINRENINVLMAPPGFIRTLLPRSEDIRADIRLIVCYAEVLEKEEKERFVSLSE